MAKRFTASRDQLTGDPRYGSKLVSKFVNCLMYDGKKSIALGAFYEAMDIVQKKLPEESPVTVFTAAVENVKPHIEVRSKRVGGATYQATSDSRLWPFAGFWPRFAVARDARLPALWLMKSLPPSRRKAPPLRLAKTCTVWPMRTRHSLTSPGSLPVRNARIQSQPLLCSGWLFRFPVKSPLTCFPAFRAYVPRLHESSR